MMREAVFRPSGRGGLCLPRTMSMNMGPSGVPSVAMPPVTAQSSRNTSGWQSLGRTDSSSSVQCKAAASGVRAVAEPETRQRSRWSKVTKEVAIAPVSSLSDSNLIFLLAEFESLAVVNVETEEQMRSRGTSWRLERERLEKVGLVAVWLPISEGEVGQQIPQAVRAVAALAEVGHSVIIASSGGFTSSGAVVAGYLSFVKGMTFDGAAQLVKQRCSEADFPMSYLSQAQESVLSSGGNRLIQIAEEVYATRVKTGAPGDANSDWVNAQQTYVSETFAKWAAADARLVASLEAVAAKRARDAATSEVEQALTLPPSASPRDGEGAIQALLRPIRWNDVAMSEALKESNLKVAMLARQLEETDQLMQAGQEDGKDSGVQLYALQGQLQALRRKESLMSEAMNTADERIQLLEGRLQDMSRERDTRNSELEKLREETKRVRELAEERSAHATQVIRGLRQELDAAQKEVKEQWTVVERAELSIEQLATMAEREEARANRAEAQAVAAETENLKLAAQLKRVVEVEMKEMERASTDRVTLMNVQIQDLTGRLAEANAAADNASRRVEFLQTQVNDLVAAGALAKEREGIASEAVQLLTSKLGQTELKLSESERRAADLAAELAAGKLREASTAAEAMANGERVRQLSDQVVSLTEKEAYQRVRADRLDGLLASVAVKENELTAGASELIAALETLAKQAVRTNADLAFSEGREGDLGIGGAVGEVLPSMGREGVLVAAERTVEIELEAVKDQPGELLRLLATTLSREVDDLSSRSKRLLQSYKEDQEAGKRLPRGEVELREYIQASEEMAREKQEQLEGEAQKYKATIGALGFAAFGLPAFIYFTYLADSPLSKQVATLSETLSATQQGNRKLQEDFTKVERGLIRAQAEAAALEGVVEAQAGAVERLQSLIPLVAPSVRSEEADKFCNNVPREFWSPVTTKFCDGITKATTRR